MNCNIRGLVAEGLRVCFRTLLRLGDAMRAIIGLARSKREKVELVDKLQIVHFVGVAAAEEARPSGGGTLLTAFQENPKDSNEMIIDNGPFARLLMEFMNTLPTGECALMSWEGTPTELHNLLGNRRLHRTADGRTAFAEGKKWFPPSPDALGRRLARLGPILQPLGYDVSYKRLNGKRKWILRKIETVEMEANVWQEVA